MQCFCGEGFDTVDNQDDVRGTIFLVEEDDDVRPNLRRSLQNYGYRVVLAVDEEDALDRVCGGVVPADIVLIDLVDKPADEVLQIARVIREQARYDGDTPLVVMAEKYGADVEGTDVNVGGNDWITYLEDPGQLKNLLARLIDKSTNVEAAQP
jgi:PleD family two-component response regulator